MKKSILTLAALMVIAIAALTTAEEKKMAEKPWFDMQNCVFCKELTAQPGLMEHMRHDYHNVSTGTISVLQVDASHMDSFKKAMIGMQTAASKMDPAKMPFMCQHCEKLGGLMMNSKIKIDQIETNFGSLTVYATQDSATMAMLHEFATRSNDEGKKMMAEMKKAEKK